MPELIEKATVVPAEGNKPKLIKEIFGRVNTGQGAISVAHMECPAGWTEPGQQPEFDELTVVLDGVLRVAHRGGSFDAHAGQAVWSRPGEWVQYSTPEVPTTYLAVCWPAFSPDSVHRDAPEK